MKRYLLALLLLFVTTTVSCQTLNQSHVGLYDALLHGAACDSTTLNAAIAASASADKQLIISPVSRALVACTWNISTSVTVPANRQLYIPPGAGFTKVASGTLTLESCPIAGRYQIFTNFATGLALNCEIAYPEWFGTEPTVFQQISDAMTTYGGVVDLDRKLYTQNTVTAKSNVVFKGKGRSFTTWKLADNQNNWAYGGESNSSLVQDEDVTNCGIEGMTLDGNASANLTSCAGCGFIAPRGFAWCRFHNLHIKNTDRDSIGSLVRTQDSSFIDLYMETNGRACIGITGGSLRNTFRDNTCISPITSCWDIEPADGVPDLFDAHYSFNTVDNWTCLTPGDTGFASTFGPNVAAGFTGTREFNTFSNLRVKQPGGSGFIIADLNNTTINNIQTHQPGQVDTTARGIWIGGYSTLGATGISLTGCVVRSNAGTGAGLYIADGDSPAVVSHVTVSGCTIADSTGNDLRVDANIQQLNLTGVTASKLSISMSAEPISIMAHGQGIDKASAAILTPLGLYSSYIITGTTQVNEVTSDYLWQGRVMTFTFDGQIIVSHNVDTTETPIYLANESNVTFCPGDTLTLRHTDVTSGESRLQEIGRSRADRQLDITSGSTPSVACSTDVRLQYATNTNVTNFSDPENNTVYIFNCGTGAGMATLMDVANGGNFNLAANLNFTCTSLDTIRLYRAQGSTEWTELGRSVN